MEKEPIYRDRKPDLETESIRAQVSNKKEAEEAEKIAEEEKHPIIIHCENGFQMRLMGFTKFIDKETEEIIFAYKFKKENKTVIYYTLDNLKADKQEKVKIFLERIKDMAKLSGFEMIDGREFAKRASEEAGRLRKNKQGLEIQPYANFIALKRLGSPKKRKFKAYLVNSQTNL